MKKHTHGPSLYYASDKNVLDALNQHRVDIATITSLFRRRNTIVSKLESRDTLAAHFARLPHDFYDHQDIAERLGVVQRRERLSSMNLVGEVPAEVLQDALRDLKQEREKEGDVVNISRDGGRTIVRVQYSLVDYGRSEFAQVQSRDGTIEFVTTDGGFTIRSSHSDYVEEMRESVLRKLDTATATTLRREVVSLFDVPVPELRSKFFLALMDGEQSYRRYDVTDVYAFKPRPGDDDEGDDEGEDVSADGAPDTHVEKVMLRGNGVSNSELLGSLRGNDYYVVKAGWTWKDLKGHGHVYAVEASFSDVKDCTDFSFMVTGVYTYENGALATKRRTPTRSEVEILSAFIEKRAQAAMLSMRDELASGTSLAASHAS